MNWNNLIRQTHRWLSIAFTVAVIVNIVALGQEEPAVRVGLLALLPLALLLFTGLYFGKRLDALIVRNVPNVRKAVKWNSPMYGIEGQGWFLGFHVFTHYVKVTFFRGTSLRPVPPGGTGKDARWIDIHEDDLDEAQMATWIRQAAALPGWGS